MKPAINFVALIAAAACAACAGAEAVIDPIEQKPVAFDSCAVARPELGGPAAQADLSLFTYDANAPLNLQKTVESTTGGVEITAISYDSPAGGRVTGRMFAPINRAGALAGIILMHGAPGSSGDGWLIEDARTFATHGAVVIAIDAPFARRKDSGNTIHMTSQDRDEQIQLMKDLQRAVDVLRAMPNVDKGRIAYMGVSYGGAMGVQFAAIDHRIKAVALVVANGGWVTHSTQPGGELTFLASLSCATRVAWFRAMIPIEPVRFISFAKPTPLLFQNGTSDEAVSAKDAQALQNAAPDPKTIYWYNAGHNLTLQAVLDRHAWLVQQIGLDPR